MDLSKQNPITSPAQSAQSLGNQIINRGGYSRPQRINWIDVAKGLLILTVVVHHIPDRAAMAGFDVRSSFQIYNFIICPFFMCAFFVITGRCTNFDKPFKPFFWQNVKTLLLPAFILGTLGRWIVLAANGSLDPLAYMRLPIGVTIKYGSPYWFITALFLAKLGYWALLRYVKRAGWRVVIQVVCLILGVMIYNFFGHNLYWHIEHALVLLLFLQVGQWMREGRLSPQWWYLLAFVVLLASARVLDIHISCTNKIGIRTIDIPLFLLLSISGSMASLWISQLIKHNRLLEFFGRHTFVMYALHGAFMTVFFNIGLACGLGCNAWTVTAITLLSILCCSLTALLLDTKYLRWTMGRFA